MRLAELLGTKISDLYRDKYEFKKVTDLELSKTWDG